MPLEPDRKVPTSFLKQVALAVELPFVLIGAILIGGAAGYWLDSKLHTRPLFILLLGALGFAGGLREVFRRIPKRDNNGGE